MTSKTAKKGNFTLTAYQGDAKTLLAFNLANQSAAKDLAGFTIQCQPAKGAAYYILNNLQFEHPGDHAQDSSQPANSSINAPIHKFRWLHVPGQTHQGLDPSFGGYKYTVTPRKFDDEGHLLPLDPGASATVSIAVQPFVSGKLSLGFARGFTQSQAFVHHFGLKALIHPKTKDFLFDTSKDSGKNAAGEEYSFADEYRWLGFTARARVFEILEEVQKNKGLHLDVFAYDLNEPDISKALLALAKQGRIRIILDNAKLHHDTKKPKPEDQFEALFDKAVNKAAKKKGTAGILRGHFSRYSHDKVLIVSDKTGPKKVLTGSTNLSVTGIYVNSNHVLIFDDRKVAGTYADIFDAAWKGGAKTSAFIKSGLSARTFKFSSKGVPPTSITFSPHTEEDEESILGAIAKRIAKEGKQPKRDGSVLFAVMELGSGSSPVYETLNKVHAQQRIFSFGISDNPKGIYLYAPGKKQGVLVTGKPASTVLPPPFDQVPGVGLGHQVHHKFVVCGFNRPDAVVYCGSSNLASGGEKANGDNLLAIQDTDVATVFAIEALGLVDHFNFLDRYAGKAKKKGGKKAAKAKQRKPASPAAAALQAHWYLSTDGGWAKSYFDPKDLHCVDRLMFGG